MEGRKGEEGIWQSKGGGGRKGKWEGRIEGPTSKGRGGRRGKERKEGDREGEGGEEKGKREREGRDPPALPYGRHQPGRCIHPNAEAQSV